MNNECMYRRGEKCLLMKINKCKGICTFKITEREFDYRREAAAKKLRDNGFEPYVKINPDGTKIMSTRRMSNEDKNN